MARRTRTETTQEMSTRRVEELAIAAADDESFSSSSFPPSSKEGGPFVFATTEASSCWSSSSSGEEEDEGDNEGIVSFSSFRNHSVGNPGNGGGNVTLFRMSVAKLPEVKSQL